MSARGDTFIEALHALCVEHGVQLGVSGYDGLELLQLVRGDDPVCSNGITDYLEDEIF